MWKIDKNDRKVQTKFIENYFGKFVDLFSSIQFIIVFELNTAHTDIRTKPAYFSVVI